jgi:hypothetical protein
VASYVFVEIGFLSPFVQHPTLACPAKGKVKWVEAVRWLERDWDIEGRKSRKPNPRRALKFPVPILKRRQALDIAEGGVSSAKYPCYSLLIPCFPSRATVSARRKNSLPLRKMV